MHPQITEIGYHCRNYFLGQWDLFKDRPWGDLAHSTHLRGQGTWDPDHGERDRVTVTLATGIPEEIVRSVNLDYLDPDTVDIAAYEADPTPSWNRTPAKFSTACGAQDPAPGEANQTAGNPHHPVWTADSFSDLDHSGARQRSQAACRLVPAILATCDHELSWARVRAANPRDSPTRRVSSSRYPKAAGSSLSASKRMLAWARSAKSLGVA